MTLDAEESERLWRTLGQLNAQVQVTHELASDLALRFDRFERTIVQRSEQAGHRGARIGARKQALIVSCLSG